MRGTMKRNEIIEFTSCPCCKAEAGNPCWDRRGHNGGKPRKRVHPSRVFIANASDKRVEKMSTRAAKAKKVKAVSFYESWEWKEARFAAMKRHGRQCQCCGWTPGSSTGNHLVVDHIKPLRTHPQLALDPENHQVLCNDCNMGKSYKHHDDFR